jgi:hypothetical protein
MSTPTPTPTIPPLPGFDVAKYYTHLSLILFVIGLVYPRGFIRTALLLNSVFVGLMGNFVMMKMADEWSRVYPASYLMLSNLIQHTIPMFIVFIILFGDPPENGKTSHYLLFLSLIFLLWACIPYQGMTMGEKIYHSYGIKAAVLVLMTALVTMSTCKSIEYMRS